MTPIPKKDTDDGYWYPRCNKTSRIFTAEMERQIPGTSDQVSGVYLAGVVNKCGSSGSVVVADVKTAANCLSGLTVAKAANTTRMILGVVVLFSQSSPPAVSNPNKRQHEHSNFPLENWTISFI